jgi:hypothetical protein
VISCHCLLPVPFVVRKGEAVRITSGERSLNIPPTNAGAPGDRQVCVATTIALVGRRSRPDRRRSRFSSDPCRRFASEPNNQQEAELPSLCRRDLSRGGEFFCWFYWFGRVFVGWAGYFTTIFYRRFAADMTYNSFVALAPGNRGVSQAPRHIVRAVMEATIMANKPLILRNPPRSVCWFSAC